MLELGTEPEVFAALVETIRADETRIRLGISILDRNEKAIQALDVPSSQIMDGTLTVDALADVTRSLDLTFLDESHGLSFDPGSPSRTGLFADNLVAVRYGVYVPSLERWIDVPVFWGPITNFERDGAEVKIEAQGKEALALDPHFATQGYTIRKGRRVDHAIRDVMDRVGETRYSLPVMRSRLHRSRAVEPEDEPWDVVKFGWESHARRLRGHGKHRHRKRVTVEYNGLISLAGNFQLFYNGLGRLTAHRRTTNPVLALREGRDLEARPQPAFDVLAAKNHVVVTGAKVTRGKKPHRHQVQMRGSATLPPGHPLSPHALRRNGKRRFMTEFVTVENLKSGAACDARARRILHERARDGFDLAFTCLPFPFLEELDVVSVITDEYAMNIPLRRFELPLTADALMTVNYER